MTETPRPTARPTIADVARVSGVSTSTVSQVLNSKGRASALTRASVLAAVREIGYGGNPAARSLRTGRTSVLGIVFRPPDAVTGSLKGTEFHVQLAGSAAARALSLNYGLLHIPSQLAPSKFTYPMDGCIVVSPVADDEILSSLISQGLPVVCVDPDPNRPDLTPFVTRIERPTINKLMDHLQERGARSFAFLALAEDSTWKRTSADAFTTWCAEAGFPGEVLELSGETGSDGARAAVANLLQNGRRPHAIIGATSRFAVGAATAATLHGLKIPEDVLVASLSDSELLRTHTPAITGIDLHGDILGQQAVATLVELIEMGSVLNVVTATTTLKLRHSTDR